VKAAEIASSANFFIGTDLPSRQRGNSANHFLSEIGPELAFLVEA